MKSLGESQLRVTTCPGRKHFHQELLRLDIWAESATSVCFKVPPGHGGHTQVFVVSTGESGSTGTGPTLDSGVEFLV